MATSTPFPSQVFHVGAGPVLDRPVPPFKPPNTPGVGPVCFRATATIAIPEVPGWTATVRGYDKSPAIAKQVEDACKVHAKKYGNTAQCSEVVLTMLKNSKLRCEGEIYADTD